MNAPGPLPFERLELIDDPTPRPAALNMALDEVFLDGLGGDALLRVYRWERPAVSFGCFEPVGPVIQTWPRHELVRRWTGGGVVEHGGDLTFSVFVPRPLALATLPAAESYRFIHAALSGAMASAGGSVPTLQTVASPAKVSHACFENPVPHDLLLAGRKVAGGAQRRTRRGLLHQGSIQHGAPTDHRTIADALPRAFGRRVDPRSVRFAEIDAAAQLVATKYGTDAWLRRF